MEERRIAKNGRGAGGASDRARHLSLAARKAVQPSEAATVAETNPHPLLQ